MGERDGNTTVGVALLGCGVVGGGVIDILERQRELLRGRTGVRFDVRHVVCREPARYPQLAGRYAVSTDAAAAIDDPGVDVVIELIGGLSPAEALVGAALRAGKAVVTANKALLAARGKELFTLARRHGGVITFEASCGGGIPIIGALTRGLLGNRITSLVGIINGTCNVVLTEMTRRGMSYTDALAGAQRQGFAEADPSADVSGRDAAHKLAILAGLAFGVAATDADVATQGIDTLEPADIGFAGELGYVVKLLAIGRREGGTAGSGGGEDGNASDAPGRISLRVHPTLVPAGDLLADVSDSFNAVSLHGDAAGHQIFYGRGAGALPTASAVVADLIACATGSARAAFERLTIYPDTAPPVVLQPADAVVSRYYLRVHALDEPGVMARITQTLGRHHISLAGLVQHEATDRSGFVPIIITTHAARDGDVRQALLQVDALPVVGRSTVCLRILDTSDTPA